MRQWVSETDHRWVMACDVRDCPVTSEPFPAGRQPDLSIFAERGWFIAKKSGDMCPEHYTRTVELVIALLGQPR